jgi:RNA polymerase sigma-70 factor, ECF subfamily
VGDERGAPDGLARRGAARCQVYAARSSCADTERRAASTGADPGPLCFAQTKRLSSGAPRNPLLAPSVREAQDWRHPVPLSLRTPLTDSELIALVLAADPRAERVFYERFVDRVYRLAYRLGGDDAFAQDCTQETFVRAFDRLQQYRGDAALGTWVCSICVSVSLNGVRARSTRQQREAPIDDAFTVAAHTREAEPDLKVRMQHAIDALPDGYRTVFLLHDVDGYTHEDIGRMLDMEPGTSKSQLSRARQKLRVALAEFEGEWA